MPTYNYLCEDGHETEQILSIREHTSVTQCSTCGKEAKQVINRAPIGTVDNMASYRCPVTDTWVTTRRQRNEIMRTHNLVEMGDTKGVHR